MTLYFLFGTTEWSYLELLLGLQAPLQANLLLLGATLIILLLGLFVKLGIGPFFAYKLEIYQGLPLYVLVFYSIIYFALFLSLFFVLFGYYFPMAMSVLRPLSHIF